MVYILSSASFCSTHARSTQNVMSVRACVPPPRTTMLLDAMKTSTHLCTAYLTMFCIISSGDFGSGNHTWLMNASMSVVWCDLA